MKKLLLKKMTQEELPIYPEWQWIFDLIDKHYLFGEKVIKRGTITNLI